MSEDELLENLINQTLDGAISAIPIQLEEIEKNKEELAVKDTKEFVYGMVMGMALGLGGALISAQKGIPTEEDQLKIRDLVYKKIPEIRERIFQ